MKKFLITFLYAVLFLSINFTDVKIDAYAKNIGSNEKALVEIKDEAIAIENIRGRRDPLSRRRNLH